MNRVTTEEFRLNDIDVSSLSLKEIKDFMEELEKHGFITQSKTLTHYTSTLRNYLELVIANEQTTKTSTSN